MAHDRRRTEIFVVKLWQDHGPGVPLWRGSLTQVVSGEIRYFSTLEQLVAQIEAQLDKRMDD